MVFQQTSALYGAVSSPHRKFPKSKKFQNIHAVVCQKSLWPLPAFHR